MALQCCAELLANCYKSLHVSNKLSNAFGFFCVNPIILKVCGCVDVLGIMHGQFAVAFVLWLAFLAFQVGKARVQKCSDCYWLLFGGQVAMLLATTGIVVWIHYRQSVNNQCTLSPEIQILLHGGDDSGGSNSRMLLLS